MSKRLEDKVSVSDVWARGPLNLNCDLTYVWAVPIGVINKLL